MSDDPVKYVPSWMPGGRFKNETAIVYRDAQATLRVPYADTKKKIVRLISVRSMLAHKRNTPASRYRTAVYDV